MHRVVFNIIFFFQVMDYVKLHFLRGSKGRLCYTRYGKLFDFAIMMMNFHRFVPKDPMKIDFMDLDSLAKLEFLKVRKSDPFTLRFRCLYQYSCN